MLSTSTPEVVNPVADACEAAGVPSLSPSIRGNRSTSAAARKPGSLRPSSGSTSSVRHPAVRGHLLPSGTVKTNKKVGVMYPNDADGNAVRADLGPLLEKGGYKIVDPGPYEDGTTDYSAQIATVQAAQLRDLQLHSQSHRTSPLSGARRHSRATPGWSRSRRLPRQACSRPHVEALGRLGYNLAGAAYWTPYCRTSPR